MEPLSWNERLEPELAMTYLVSVGKVAFFYSCQADKLGKFMLLGRAVVAPADI
jgi:hypothetical protein